MGPIKYKLFAMGLDAIVWIYGDKLDIILKKEKDSSKIENILVMKDHIKSLNIGLIQSINYDPCNVLLDNT